MKQKFFGEFFPVNLLFAVILVILFTGFIRIFFPYTSPKNLEIERLLVE